MARDLRKRFCLLVLAGVAIIALGVAATAAAAPRPAVVKLTTARVGDPGNPSVGIVPFTDAVYSSCDDAPAGDTCLTVGDVDRPFGIGRLEVTVKKWVAFLNTVDPKGKNPHNLYNATESSTAWPKYGAINKSGGAADGHHYSVAYRQWESKPYAFANFLRAARFVNSLYNGRVISKESSNEGGFKYVTYGVRLSKETETGMYDLSKKRAKRSHRSGFVIPSQNEWIKAAYFDPSGGGTDSYWKYPTNEGVFGDNTATAPTASTLNQLNGEVTNSATQPLATYHDTSSGGPPAPTWCPLQIEPRSDCTTVNPFGLDPIAYRKAYQGSVGTVGEAGTFSPWGTLDQGGNVVEWTDTITPPPAGQNGARVWRRLHGGIANAPAYQLWLSAVGLNPQNNAFYNQTYPWLGFRIGVIGQLKAGD